MITLGCLEVLVSRTLVIIVTINYFPNLHYTYFWVIAQFIKVFAVCDLLMDVFLFHGM